MRATINIPPTRIRIRAVAMQLVADLDGHYVEMQTIAIACEVERPSARAGTTASPERATLPLRRSEMPAAGRQLERGRPREMASVESKILFFRSNVKSISVPI
jgi:hypothetical protein